jgi:hypothetical protein
MRPEKKTEMLEVRLGHAAKAAFMARCRQEGLTASDVVRDLIEARLRGGQAKQSGLGLAQVMAAAVAGLAIGAAAAPSVAQTVGGTADFQRLDRNHDGVLSAAEFAAR